LSFPEGRRPRRSSRPREAGPATDQQTILIRRGIAVGAGLLILVLLIFGIRGCLDARKDRAFENYAADVRALVQESNNLSTQFFTTLSKPKGADALDVQNEINAQSTDAEQLAERAQDTDHPDELDQAHGWLVTSLEFRRDALSKIAERIPAALGDRGRKPAITSIAAQMQALLASDVIYLQRAIPELRSEYADRGINERFPLRRFLPDLGWLDPDTVDSRLSKIGNLSKEAAPGLHGSGLQGVTAKPSGTQLTAGGVNRIALSPQLAFQISVQNQGESEETDVGVSITIKNGQEINVEQTIDKIAAGDTQTVDIPVSKQPETGAVNELTVEVAAVPGEKVKDNNRATYQVVFSETAG
jgi:hypothetical protein